MANYLDLVVKLLAKAEGTNNQVERDAYLEKAQSLATTYQIEQGLIDQARRARGEQVQVAEGMAQRRFCEERNTKLIKAKRELIMWLADVNSCFVVMGPRRSYLQVTGHESDVMMVQHLFSSILLQLQRAMAQAEPGAVLMGTLDGWRVSFAHGYVRRVGNRLLAAKNARTQATDAAPGTAVVLRDRAQLSKQFAEGENGGEFRKGRKTRIDANNPYGRSAGDQAGRNADLGGDRLGSTTNRQEIGS